MTVKWTAWGGLRETRKGGDAAPPRDVTDIHVCDVVRRWWSWFSSPSERNCASAHDQRQVCVCATGRMTSSTRNNGMEICFIVFGFLPRCLIWVEPFVFGDEKFHGFIQFYTYQEYPSESYVQSGVETFLPGFGHGWLKHCAIVHLWGGQQNILGVILRT